MSDLFLNNLNSIKKLIKEYRSIFEKNNVKAKIDQFQSLILKENFWNDKINAQKILKEKKIRGSFKFI